MWDAFLISSVPLSHIPTLFWYPPGNGGQVGINPKMALLSPKQEVVIYMWDKWECGTTHAQAELSHFGER